ncbi:MAG: hypothetical protein KTR21_17505 [Rhodobacteraceae bacterium]|nr:hypothetical protein [Paracoccaceae bacterium]
MTTPPSQSDRPASNQDGAVMDCGPDRLSAYDPSARAELAFCSSLEDAANQLPALCLGRFLKFGAALRLMPERQEARRIEERFSQILLAQDNAKALAAALAMIDLEEREDADIAIELADALDAAAAAGEVVNPNALGYLMRSFFENRRRHLAWRREAFIEPARRMLEATAFTFVTEPLQESRAELRVLAALDEAL